MANSYKVLGQSAPTAGSLTTAYTVPASTETVVSTISICNRGPSTLARIAVRPAGAAILDKHYVVYDVTVSQYDTIFLTVGLTLEATDIISVYGLAANLSFNIYGSEIT